MIALFNKTFNKNFGEKITNCKHDINNIKEISSILHIENIEETDNINQNYNIIQEILHYEETLIINDYANFTCPCCKKEGTLSFHKIYSRNFLFNVGNYRISSKIDLIVLECSFCKEQNNKQKYHTLIPNIIFPYRIHSEKIILSSINDYFNKKLKIKDIENKYNISYQLLYYWHMIMKKYIMASSIILKIPSNISDIITGIISNTKTFLYKFYQKYYHPFFLNKKTCVPLAITP